MNKEPKDYKEETSASDIIYWTIISVLVIAILVSVMLLADQANAGGMDYSPPEKNIDCAPLIPSDLYSRTGWKPIEAGDELRIAGQVSAGNVKVQRRQTLLCKNYADSKVSQEFLISQWWWKRK